MSDKPLVLDVPEELMSRAEAAHIDMRQVMLDALASEVYRVQSNQAVRAKIDTIPDRTQSQKLNQPDSILPPLTEVEVSIQASIERIKSGQADLRIFDLSKGTVWVSDDFDDPLPDSFWLGEDFNQD